MSKNVKCHKKLELFLDFLLHFKLKVFWHKFEHYETQKSVVAVCSIT